MYRVQYLISSCDVCERDIGQWCIDSYLPSLEGTVMNAILQFESDIYLPSVYVDDAVLNTILWFESDPRLPT